MLHGYLTLEAVSSQLAMEILQIFHELSSSYPTQDNPNHQSTYVAESLIMKEPGSGRQEWGLSPWAIPLDRDNFNNRDPDPSNRGYFCKSVEHRRDICRKGMEATLTNTLTGEDLSRTQCSGAQTYKVRCRIGSLHGRQSQKKPFHVSRPREGSQAHPPAWDRAFPLSQSLPLPGGPWNQSLYCCTSQLFFCVFFFLSSASLRTE